MSANTAPVRISELDFFSIKQNLIDYMKSQSEFSDYDFTGSSLNILMDILSYNTHYLSYYMNAMASESFLDSAQLRDSVLSHVKLLGYLPNSKRGAVAIVNVKVTPPLANSTSVLTLPKNTSFFSESIDGINYNFVNLETTVASKNASGYFLFSNVAITEGEPVSYNFPVTTVNTKRRFTIPSSDIDTSSLTIEVQVSSSNTDKTIYTLNDDITEITANSTVYFLEESQTDTYTLYFGDGYLGKNLSNGNIVIASYLETNGVAGNKANVFTCVNSVGGFSNVIVTTASIAASGANKESIDDIKFRAPISYTTQNRAVTKKDYELLLLKDYPNIDAISVWGGEDNDPIVYGKVFISIKPKENYSVTLAEKDRIKNEVIQNRSVLTVTPEIVDPEYIYLKLILSAQYDPNLTNLSESALETIIRNVVYNYAATELNDFNSVFRESKLHRQIEDAEKSIKSSAITIWLQKRVELTLNSSKNYTIEFENPLKKSSFPDKLYSFPSVTVSDLDGISRNIYFEEVQQSYTGVDSISIINPGSNYTTAPTITITGDGTGATAEAKIVNGKISSITVLESGTDYSVANITITGDGTGATAKARLLYRLGTLRTFYYKTNGEKSIVNSNAGTIDYESGTIVLTSFNPTAITTNSLYESNVLTFNVLPDVEILQPIRNKIITLDESDSTSVQVEVTAEI